MLKDYLEKQKRISSENKELLENELTDIENKIRETEKFKELISAENEPPFAEFSPHTVSTRAEEKIAELDDSLAKMNEQREIIIAKLEALELSIMELTAALNEADKLTGAPTPAPSEKNEDTLNDVQKSDRSDSQDISSILSTLNQIKSVTISDPYMAQSMITQLISKLSD